MTEEEQETQEEVLAIIVILLMTIVTTEIVVNFIESQSIGEEEMALLDYFDSTLFLVIIPVI